MPTFFGKILCWIGFHVKGREKSCVIEDPTRRRWIWCKTAYCTRCSKRLTLRKTGAESKIRIS